MSTSNALSSWWNDERFVEALRKREVAEEPSEDEIRRRAYQIYESRNGDTSAEPRPGEANYRGLGGDPSRRGVSHSGAPPVFQKKLQKYVRRRGFDRGDKGKPETIVCDVTFHAF